MDKFQGTDLHTVVVVGYEGDKFVVHNPSGEPNVVMGKEELEEIGQSMTICNGSGDMSLQSSHRNGYGFIELKKSIRNRTHGAKPPYLIEIHDCGAVGHEVGHAVMTELTFGKKFQDSPKKPHYKVAFDYAVKKYLVPEGVENAGEGWAQSFDGYIENRELLKRESPQLYEYWKDIFSKNPKIMEIYKNTLDKAKDLSVCSNQSYQSSAQTQSPRNGSDTQSSLEIKALELKKAGKTEEEIERELGHEFIFYKDPMTGKYKRATLWKKSNQSSAQNGNNKDPKWFVRGYFDSREMVEESAKEWKEKGYKTKIILAVPPMTRWTLYTKWGDSSYGLGSFTLTSAEKKLASALEVFREMKYGR